MAKEYLNTTLELKSIGEPVNDSSGSFAYFEGYAAAFGNVDSYYDVIMAGAFKACLDKKPKVKMLWQHNMHSPIGSYMELFEDSYGLYVKGRINLGTEHGKEAYALLKAGDLEHLSIGYITKDSEMTEGGVRILKEIDLFEVSIVTRPANDQAMIVSVKALLDEVETITDIELILKNKGFSNKEAKTFISKFKQISEKRDVSPESSTQRDVEVKNVTSELVKSISELTQLINGKTKND